MVDRFEQLFSEEMRQAAEAHGMTMREAVTLASIVEKETARAEERPIVCGRVYESPARANALAVRSRRSSTRWSGRDVTTGT
jgi:UPF0755 protein